ncbi:MAG: type II secretory pathway pseudopilin PulG [Psychroserpens sp.]|jgi:type II secretory pathway pseudopilin PulG
MMNLNTLKLQYNQGVTLIELLVVITIMMTMLTLVSPLAMNTIDKAEAQREYLSFCNLLRHISVQAFSNGSGINVTLNQNVFIASLIPLNIGSDEEVFPIEYKIIVEREYEYLIFQETELKFNKNGMPNISTINFTQRNKVKNIDLIALLEN